MTNLNLNDMAFYANQITCPSELLDWTTELMSMAMTPRRKLIDLIGENMDDLLLPWCGSPLSDFGCIPTARNAYEILQDRCTNRDLIYEHGLEGEQVEITIG